MTDTTRISPEDAAKLAAYRCHKVVRAGVIVAVQSINSAPCVDVETPITTAGRASHARWILSPAWGEKHQPKVGDWLVVYEDGYVSISPAKAFEDGYTRIEE